MSTEELLHEGLVPTPGKRIRRPGLHALTGIRFFAAFWVLLFHFGAGFFDHMHMPSPFIAFLRHGGFGVCLFFMLSGFILYYTYQDNLKTGRDLYKYFVARLARVYPVYLLALVIATCLSRTLPQGREWLVIPLLQAWFPVTSKTGMAVIGQAWTLSVELFFYLCFPLLLLFFRRRRSPAVLWSIAGLMVAIGIAFHAPNLAPGVFDSWVNRHILLPVLRLPEFILGMSLGALFMERQSASPDWRTNDWLTLAGLIPGGIVISLRVEDRYLIAAALFSFAWAIFRLAVGKGWLTNLLSSPPMLLLGGASFSIYILQAPIRNLMHVLFAHFHPGLDAAVTPVVLIVFCCFLFLYYEEPMRGVVRRVLIGK
ncbi:acyltransferase [Granulicella sp. WH15]|uniref:acyltransferase family protein n=1 Tax=Granulicella sp. WH15 TaxID=2602070 RepID=UPI0013A54616|nr:acyltransferase [Granulicella sp. WH15]